MPSKYVAHAFGPSTRAPALGLGISVLAHVLVVAWLWHTWLPGRNDRAATPVTRIEVRLVPITSKVPLLLPEPAPNAAIPPSSTGPTRAVTRPASARRPPSASVASAAPNEPATAPTAEAAANTDANVPTFDLAAARAAARLIAREDEKGLVALPQRKPMVGPSADDQVAGSLERARRVDCQTARANSTNLLANVIMLAKDMVANAIDDSGCKW